ncbi:MAG: hypothetical protein MK132_06950 [Lentisphaerales bacterium]|nr:hypothetical protein [Lentisphaerales bacterium]
MTTEKQQKYSLMAAVFQLFMGAFVAGLWLKYEGFLPVEFLIQAGNTLVIGFLISVLAWRHNAMAWKASIEKRDRGLATEQEKIFSDDDEYFGRFEKSFLQFNKVLLPFILVAISVIEIGLSLRVYLLEASELSKNSQTLLIPVTLMLSFSLISFLVGKFFSGLAHREAYVFLRPVCGYLLYNSFTMFLAGIAALNYHFGVMQPLVWFVNFSIGLSCLIAIERLFLWIVDMYRPKSKNEGYLPIYESRILALFSQPKGVLGNLAAMLEYQFGIKVSESLFASFSKKVLLPYVSLQLLSLFALSSVTYIKPSEKALKMSWGDKDFTILEPGIYFGAPWPMSSIERLDVHRVTEVDLTENAEFEKKLSEARIKPLVDNWDQEEYNELLNLAAQINQDGQFSQNLVALNVKLSYRIQDVLKFRGAYENTEAALIMTGRKILTRTLLESNFNETIKSGLKDFHTKLKASLVDVCAEEFGVEVIDVSVINFQPPPEVVEAYRSVHIALEERERLAIKADKYSNSRHNLAELDVDLLLKKATQETVLRKLLLDKELQAFNDQKEVYEKLPVLYKAIALMTTYEAVLKDVRKVVNLTGTQNEIITLELKKSTPDLLELE